MIDNTGVLMAKMNTADQERTPQAPVVRTGATILAGRPSLVGSGRFGLLTKFTGTMPDLGRNVDALLAAGLNVTALFDFYTALMSAKGCLVGQNRACGFMVGGSSKFELAGP
jgi:hypothetical protein